MVFSYAIFGHLALWLYCVFCIWAYFDLRKLSLKGAHVFPGNIVGWMWFSVYILNLLLGIFLTTTGSSLYDPAGDEATQRSFLMVIRLAIGLIMAGYFIMRFKKWAPAARGNLPAMNEMISKSNRRILILLLIVTLLPVALFFLYGMWVVLNWH